MSQSEQKIVQYLNEAHLTEMSLINVLRSQIAMTPIGSYRDGLEEHLDETRNHARRVEERLGKLGEARNPIQVVLGYTEAVFGQMLALSKTPLALVRGSGGEEKVLKNAKDACATEALEIATYSALERLAARIGDVETAKLAASIRGDEERMLKRIMREIPQLTDDVVAAELEDQVLGEMDERGSARAAPQIARTGKKTAPRRTPTARASENAGGAGSSARQRTRARRAREQPPIQGYDSLSAEEITSRLRMLSQSELAKVGSYERNHEQRTAVLTGVGALQGPEPWPGYDQLSDAEIKAVLDEGDDQRAQDVVAYERLHKNRPDVLQSALIPARFSFTSSH